MSEAAEPTQSGLVSIVIGVIVSIILAGTGPSIWYVPLTLILALALLPYWHILSAKRTHQLTYAFVFGFALIPGLAWLLSPIQPIIFEGIRLTWWNIRDQELDLFLFWLLFSGGVYVARR